MGGTTGSTGAGGSVGGVGAGGTSGARNAGSTAATTGSTGGAGGSQGGSGGTPVGAGEAGDGMDSGATGGRGAGGSPPDASTETGTPDGGHPICPVGSCKLVFVSTDAIDGNEGSAAAMDAVCQARAVVSNLAGTWRAWASDSNSSVAMRFTQATVPYRLLDGSTIANDWTDLTDGALAHPINVLDDGTVSASALEVWTATTTTGGTTLSCSDWTTNSSTLLAIFGRTDLTTVGWTFQAQEFCNVNLRVYCFEQ